MTVARYLLLACLSAATLGIGGARAQSLTPTSAALGYFQAPGAQTPAAVNSVPANVSRVDAAALKRP
jgi:hypothetical protein